METLEYIRPGGARRPQRRVHVGVVASGNLEVLLEPAATDRSHVVVRTSADGFGSRWQDVIDRFFARHDVAVEIAINDFGATPPTVLLRLEQAIEQAFP
jgi:malonate decarboxylase delta subunit